jgi:hypothetical protein
LPNRAFELSCLLVLGSFIATTAAYAADIPLPAKKQLIKQDSEAGYVAKLAKIVNKPLPKGTTFPLPTDPPTEVGATLRFFKPRAAVGSPDVALPAANWVGLGKPPGSQGWKYEGAGSGSDPCKIVVVKEKVIKAVCKGPNAFDSPSPYSLPVGNDDAAAWELVIGGDRYCAQSWGFLLTDIKEDDGVKGVFKALNAGPPPACASCDHDVCTGGGALLASCGACAATVCAQDNFCCVFKWDASCVDEASRSCGACG